MGIYKHPKTSVYYANFFDTNNKRQRISLHTKDKRIAEIKFADIRRRSAVLRQGVVVNILWDDFRYKMMGFLKLERKEGTITHYRIAFDYCEKYLRPKHLADIDPLKLQELKQILKLEGVGNAGINKYIKCLKACFRLAEKWQLLPVKQEWDSVSKLKESKGRLLFYTVEELNQLLKACNIEWQAVIRLGAQAGLRRGEMAALKWQDIDFKNNLIYVAANKTENSRYVPMSPDLRKFMQDYAKITINKEYVVIVGWKDGINRQSQYFISSCWGKIRKKAGIYKGTIHTLRHTFASHLVQNGVDLYTVSKLLGHSSIKMTEIYAHLAPHTFQQAVLKVPKLK